MADPFATDPFTAISPAPVSKPADHARIIEAARAYSLALADHAAKKAECDAECAAYEEHRDAGHAELATAADVVAKAQAALLEASK